MPNGTRRRKCHTCFYLYMIAFEFEVRVSGGNAYHNSLWELLLLTCPLLPPAPHRNSIPPYLSTNRMCSSANNRKSEAWEKKNTDRWPAGKKPAAINSSHFNQKHFTLKFLEIDLQSIVFVIATLLWRTGSIRLLS